MTRSKLPGQDCSWGTMWFPPSEVASGELLGGWSCIAASDSGIIRVVLPQRTLATALAVLRAPVSWRFGWTDNIVEAYWQIRQYLGGYRTEFTVAIDLAGLSDFRQSVLTAVSTIPIGQVLSYNQVALQIGAGRASRAVGQTMAHNPVPILIPCHRVVGSNGQIGGFGGGTAQKRALLALEGFRASESAR